MRVAFLIVLSVVGLAAALSLAQAPQATSEAKTGEEQPEAAVVQGIPPAAKARRNPLQATDENLERGFQLYSSQCAMCHGARGVGDGALAKSLKIDMPDFTDPAAMKRRTDGELFFILTQGHGRMPGEGERLPEDFRWSMILAVRSMARNGG